MVPADLTPRDVLPIPDRKRISLTIAAKAFIRTIIILAALSVLDSITHAQETPPPPSSSSTQSPADKPKTDAPKPAPTPEPDFWHREELTGDWGGTRSRLKSKGFETHFSLTQFYQGVASGGVDTDSEYNGTFQTLFKFDFGKLVGWKFWSAEIKTETRFGGPVLTGTGAINVVNTAALIPGSDGTVFSVTGVNVTKLFPINLKEGDLFAVSGGRYNLLDLSDEKFFGGGGIERFFNIAQIGPLTVLRQVPLVTNLVSFAYVRHGEPFITFALVDPNDHSTDPGLSDLFADGVTFMPGINFPSKFFGKPGKHSFGLAITTKALTPFDAIRQIILPGPPINPIQPQRGSWSASYIFRQYIVERSEKQGWGLFGQLAFADQDTSPVTRFFDIGLGGSGLLKSRLQDEFGISYAYTDLSDVLKDNLTPLALRQIRPEHQVEMFYNLHITPWLRLTGDFQIIRPVRPIADTAIVPGGRLEVVF
jgi:porin